MPLSPGDRGFLISYGFVGLYNKYRDRLVTLAKGTFQYMRTKSGLMPDEQDLITQLEAVLTLSTVFADIIADLAVQVNLPGPTDPFWPEYFAGPVSNLVVDSEWQDIVS